MSAVNDPNFWKRFSIAVHQSDAEKEELAKGHDLKHSYVAVTPLEESEHTALWPLTTPPSQSPAQSPTMDFTTLRPFSPSPHSPPLAAVETRQTTPPRTPPASNRHTRLQKPRSKNPESTKSPRRPSLAHIHSPFARHTNSSHLTLGLSGRPPSRFKFWTSVTADPSNRDSWLVSQQRKRRQRTWICWAFWLGVVLVVGGAVAAILVLRAKGVI